MPDGKSAEGKCVCWLGLKMGVRIVFANATALIFSPSEPFA